jgi:hypothetical protein
VQGMSKAAQALHGGPDSSHCDATLVSALDVTDWQNVSYLNLADTTRVACLAQTIGFLGSLSLGLRTLWLCDWRRRRWT